MTKPLAGVPYHPEVTRVVFETTGASNAEPEDVYARRLLTRTVGHLDRVSVEALVMEALRARPEIHRELDYHELAQMRVLLEQVIESVLDAARTTLRTRMAIDIASTLIPRLKGTRS